jgi:hypothetical protein
MSHSRLHRSLTALIGVAILWRLTAGAGYLEAAAAAKAQHKDDKVVVLETDLVADTPGLVDGNDIVHSAFVIDTHLVNPWGATEGPTSPFWVADNGEGVSTLYSVPGAASASLPAPS